MKLTPTLLPEVVVVEPEVYADGRGWFMESFNERQFHQALKALGCEQLPVFVQDNHSLSHQGVLRGLHYQLPPCAQGKLVRVVQGRVFDVAVDLRKDSTNFGRWVAVELDAVHHRQLWIPAGFAHGSLALEDNTQFLYKTTEHYAKEYEQSIRWNDEQLAIAWPLEGLSLRISSKDQQACSWRNAKVFEGT